MKFLFFCAFCVTKNTHTEITETTETKEHETFSVLSVLSVWHIFLWQADAPRRVHTGKTSHATFYTNRNNHNDGLLVVIVSADLNDQHRDHIFVDIINDAVGCRKPTRPTDVVSSRQRLRMSNTKSRVHHQFINDFQEPFIQMWVWLLPLDYILLCTRC